MAESNSEQRRFHDIIPLLMEEYGWKFEGPFYEDVPRPNLDDFPRVREEIQNLQSHLLETIVIDAPQLHEWGGRERESFIADLNTKYGLDAREHWYMKYSKLRVANLYVVNLDMGNIIENSEPGLKPTLEEIFAPVMFLSSLGYKGASFDAKKEYVKRLDEAIYRFLEVLAGESERKRQQPEVNHVEDIIYSDGQRYYFGSPDSRSRIGINSQSGRLLTYLLEHLDTRIEGDVIVEETGSKAPNALLAELKCLLRSSDGLFLNYEWGKKGRYVELIVY